MTQQRTIQIFNRARDELYCPPCRLAFEAEGEEEFLSPAPLCVLNGIVSLKPGMIPLGSDHERFLLWHFRHELAHVHHCPYDIKTAYSLERAAYETAMQRDLAYLATYIFSDLQVNLNYLPKRFQEFPYSIKILQERRPIGLGQILHEIYKQALPEIRRSAKGDIAEAAKEIYAIVRSTKPWHWHLKVQMIAMILDRLRARNRRLFSKGGIGKYIREHPIPVREDFYPDSIRMFENTYGTIQDQEEAREFFKQWIEPRISKREKERLKEALKKKVKMQKRGRKEKKIGKKLGESSHPFPRKLEAGETLSREELSGGEPILPTSLSQPYKKIGSQVLDEALWKRYWYKSKAERMVIQYLADSPSRRPVWSVMKYPDEWYIEDEIEALDIEMSLDEGSLLPEVTTLKWVEEPASQGQSVITGFVPSAVIVLDASYSMHETHDTAATAAFITYLSANKAGGQTSVITFSTKYVAANWSDPNETKELVLSMNFDEFTIFPAYEIMKLTSTASGYCFILVITDGGWQNIDEAIPLLERITDRGHKVFIFQLPGGEYPDRIKKIHRSPELSIYKVDNPERDLKGLVLSKTMRTYQTFIT